MRQMMPELMAVLPPTQRPWSSGIGALPKATCEPPSRMACASAPPASRGRSEVFRRAPSSSITTE